MSPDQPDAPVPTPGEARSDRQVERSSERQVERSSEQQVDRHGEPEGAEGGFGVPGKPLNRRSPFYVGFVGALGVLAGYGLVHAITMVTSVLTLLVVSLFLALGLDPVVQLLQTRGMRRRWAVAVVLVLVVALFSGVVALIVPLVIKEATDLAASAPQLTDNLLKNRTLRSLDRQYGVLTTIQDQLTRRVKDQSLWTSLFGGVLGAGKAVLSGFFSAFTVLVLTLYFLASLPSVKASAYRMVPRSRRQRVTFLSEEITRRVGGYFIGQLGVATINGVCSYLMMSIIGIPYAAVLAVIVGLLGLVPMVGATIGALVVLVVALFSSTSDAIVVSVYYVLYQQVENYVIAPRVMKRTVSVPGAVTVIAALIGASLLGVLGALLAIPAAAGLLLIYEEVLLPRQHTE